MIRVNSVKVSADIEKLRKSLTAARAYIVGREVVQGVALGAKAIIKARTQRGLDSSGEPFKEYTKDYAEIKAKSGRNTKPVDLTFSGRMLNSMDGVFISERKGAVVFSRGEEALKALGNNRRRKFFDVKLERELAALSDAALKLIDAKLKSEGLA